MKFILHDLAIETTRRCNMHCAHCMRGESQNVDLTPDIIDVFFDNNEFERIDHICFSGGEPTLNPSIIIYTIDKIIRENINVCEIAMVTNGQVFVPELVEAFNRFNEYRNRRLMESIIGKSGHVSDLAKKIMDTNMDNHARITFSVDRFHEKISSEVEKKYMEHGKGLKITKFAVKEEDIYKTGFSAIGKSFEYKLPSLKYTKESDAYFVLNNIYLTAKGYLTSEGNGQYIDMDTINIGHVSEITIRDALVNYGEAIFDAPPITSSRPMIKKF